MGRRKVQDYVYLTVNGKVNKQNKPIIDYHYMYFNSSFKESVPKIYRKLRRALR